MLRVWLKLYSLIYILFGLFYILVCLFSPRKRSIIRARLQKPPFVPRRKQPVRIWIHAVSVGEVNAVRPLADSLISADYELFMSTTTQTGQELAQNIFKDRAEVFYFPVDLRNLCRRWLKAVNPSAVLLVETEIWPNFLAAASQLAIPVVLVNGRISDSSYKNYSRGSFFFGSLLKLFSRFCMQSKEDKKRIIQLGAEEEKTHWVGNLKYDLQIDSNPEKQKIVEQVRDLMKPADSSLIWLCGSTKPGEEKMILAVYQNLLKRFEGLSLILAPRHPDRAEEILEEVEIHGLSGLRRSQIQSISGSTPFPQILILDTIGELAHLYQLADVVFIGGSLVPEGGQNPLEPASYRRPVLFGPHMENFREIAQTLVSRYAALQVKNTDELDGRLSDLLGDETARTWLGRNARKVILENRGAVDKTRKIIENFVLETIQH